MKLADPNFTLGDMLATARRIKLRLAGKQMTSEQHEAYWLACLVEELHEHISEGGDFPRDWKPF